MPGAGEHTGYAGSEGGLGAPFGMDVQNKQDFSGANGYSPYDFQTLIIPTKGSRKRSSVWLAVYLGSFSDGGDSVSARGDGFRWSLSAPRPGVLRKGFCSLKVWRTAHEGGLIPLTPALSRKGRGSCSGRSFDRLRMSGDCAGRPACELALAPLRPRRVDVDRTLVLAGTGMRFGVLTG